MGSGNQYKSQQIDAWDARGLAPQIMAFTLSMIYDFFEGIFIFTLLTLSVVPCLIGYLAYRYTQLGIRIIPTGLQFFAGLWAILYRAHKFNEYCFLLLLYAASCALGLLLRTRRERKSFWDEYHFDWLLCAGMGAIYFFLAG